MAAVTYDNLRQQIRKGQLSPVYILHGEEGYYTDQLVKEFEQALPEADREFNQYILYAPEVLAGQVMDLCQRYPMMADRQLVILKEAQSARADQVNRLAKYVLAPNPTTTLVIVFRGDKGKGKDLMDAAKKNAVVFESKKPTDWQLGPLIETCIREKGFTADPKSIEMLREHIGNDLSRLYNEVDKLAVILPTGARITPDVIERNIGISKEYNTFELIDAVATKDAAKAMRIADYFASNPKAAPLVMVTASLYGLFSDLLIVYYCKDQSDKGLMDVFGYKSTFPLKRLRAGKRAYTAFQVIEAIWALRKFDVESKGKGSRMNAFDLFHDLIFHLLTAPGNLGV